MSHEKPIWEVETVCHRDVVVVVTAVAEGELVQHRRRLPGELAHKLTAAVPCLTRALTMFVEGTAGPQPVRPQMRPAAAWAT